MTGGESNMLGKHTGVQDWKIIALLSNHCATHRLKAHRILLQKMRNPKESLIL